MNHMLHYLCDFIHEVQKERGSASMYLRSGEGLFSEEMEAQFFIVDERRKPLDALPKKHSVRIDPFLNALNYLPAKRKYIIARMVDPSEVLQFYTRDLISPAIEIAQELAVLDPSNNPARVSAFVNFVHWKERIGLERALGTQLVNVDWSNSSDFRNRLDYIVSEQMAYERMFLALVDDDGRSIIEKLKTGNEIFRRIDQINTGLIKGDTKHILQSITAGEWFNLFTAKMDLLHEVGKTIIDNMVRTSASPDVSNVNKPVQLEQTQMESTVRPYYEMIQLLPLFQGLDPQTLQDILKYARVVSHNKGVMIFIRGEQATRFYIVLEGWVKLFKGNVDGQESVLQVIATGEALLETVIFNNAPFPANAQAVDAVKLLSIPASIIREKLQNNKELAVNMLSTVAGRSQELISQFEQLTLKTVTQRVGWFLLKLYLNGGERSIHLKLPYDKALIAGYLGMKPETFSRTLQSLKEQGIDIDRNMVTLKDIYTLCDYCDLELSAKCSRAGTADCPNPDCSKAT